MGEGAGEFVETATSIGRSDGLIGCGGDGDGGRGWGKGLNILWTTLPRNRIIVRRAPLKLILRIVRRQRELPRFCCHPVPSFRGCLARDIPRTTLRAVGIAAHEGGVKDHVTAVD